MGTTLRSKIAIWMGLVALVSAPVAVVVSGGRRLAPSAIAVVVASPVLGWLIGRIVAQRIVAPLERLGVVCRSFAAGNHCVRVPTPTGRARLASSPRRSTGWRAQIDDAFEELKREERRKTQFVTDVSHELRTPLTAIRGAAETLARRRRRTRRPAALPLDDRARGRAARPARQRPAHAPAHRRRHRRTADNARSTCAWPPTARPRCSSRCSKTARCR